jgi:hypothetical protein
MSTKFELVKQDWNEGKPRIVEAYDAETAVQDWCNTKFSDWDYPKDITIFVREVGTETWTKYEIEVVPVPDFVLGDPKEASAEEAEGLA